MGKPRWETKRQIDYHDKPQRPQHRTKSMCHTKLEGKREPTKTTRSNKIGYNFKSPAKYHNPHIQETGKEIQYDIQQLRGNHNAMKLWPKRRTGQENLTRKQITKNTTIQ